MDIIKHIAVLAVATIGLSACAQKEPRVETANHLSGRICLGWFDLAGAPTNVNFQYPPQSEATPCTQKKTMVMPALFVKTYDQKDHQTLGEVLIPDNGGMISIWRGPLRSSWLSAINSIQLVRAENGSNVLDISIYYTSLPAKGDKPFRPGPPIERRYTYRDGAYVSSK